MYANPPHDHDSSVYWSLELRAGIFGEKTFIGAWSLERVYLKKKNCFGAWSLEGVYLKKKKLYWSLEFRVGIYGKKIVLELGA